MKSAKYGIIHHKFGLRGLQAYSLSLTPCPLVPFFSGELDRAIECVGAFNEAGWAPISAARRAWRGLFDVSLMTQSQQSRFRLKDVYNPT